MDEKENMTELNGRNLVDLGLKELHTHILRFSDLYDTKCVKLEENRYIKLREVLYAMVWLSRTLSLPLEDRALTAVAMVHQINHIKNYLFTCEVGDVIRSLYEKDLDIKYFSEFERIIGYTHTDIGLYLFNEEDKSERELLEECVLTLKSIEFLAYQALSSDGNIEMKDDRVLIDKDVNKYLYKAAIKFSELYTKEYLQGIVPFENAQFYNDTLNYNSTYFSSVLICGILQRKYELFLRLSSLAYQPILKWNFLMSLEMHSREDVKLTMMLPTIFLGPEQSTEEKLEKYNEWCKKELL